MKPFCVLVVALAAFPSCDWMSRRTQHRGTPVVVDDTVLRYPDSSTFLPGVGDVAVIGQLEAETAAPFVIIAAHGCHACEHPDAVLVRAPSTGRVTEGDRRGMHPYPGHTFRGASGSIRTFARVFWGECLPQRPPGVVSFRSEFDGPGDEPLRELRITEVHGDSLIDWRTVPDVRMLAAALQQVRARRCTELPARETASAP